MVCAQNKKSHHQEKPKPELLFQYKPNNSSVMSSFNDSFVSESFIDSDRNGGGDICDIFDFDKDDGIVGWIQSEWDKETSTTMKKRKLEAFLTDNELSIHYSGKLKAIVCCPRNDCSCLLILCDPDMCSALLSYLVYFEQKSKYEQDSILLQ